MGHIITINSKDFINKFIKSENVEKFNYLLISSNITSNGTHRNVYTITSLLPPPNVMSIYINEGASNTFVKKYNEYLSLPKIDSIITVIVKLAIIENTDVVLINSEDEDSIPYMKIISKYIKKEYKVPTLSYKKYCNIDRTKPIDNKKEVTKIITSKIKNFDINATPNVDKTDMKNKLKSLSKSELIHLCKEKHIKISTDYTKSDIIKKILKKF